MLPAFPSCRPLPAVLGCHKLAPGSEAPAFWPVCAHRIHHHRLALPFCSPQLWEWLLRTRPAMAPRPRCTAWTRWAAQRWLWRRRQLMHWGEPDARREVCRVRSQLLQRRHPAAVLHCHPPAGLTPSRSLPPPPVPACRCGQPSLRRRLLATSAWAAPTTGARTARRGSPPTTACWSTLCSCPAAATREWAPVAAAMLGSALHGSLRTSVCAGTLHGAYSSRPPLDTPRRAANRPAPAPSCLQKWRGLELCHVQL